MTSLNFEFEIKPSASTLCMPAKNRHSTNSQIEKDESATEPTKCRYRPQVLVGNWFDRRVTYIRPPNDWLTVYATTYTCKSNSAFKKDRIALNENKSRAERGLGAEFLISHSQEVFHKNYTATNDLFFRILPQVRKCNGRKNLRLPEIDLTKSFGNLTKLCIKVEFKKTKFNNKYSEKICFKSKGELNKPQLIHLDIDPNLPFQPHLIKSET